MALNIFRVMVFKLGVTVQEATERTSAIMSLCSETVRRWVHSFYCQNTTTETAIPESKRGCHSKQQSLIDVSEGLKNDARRHVKENSWVKGKNDSEYLQGSLEQCLDTIPLQWHVRANLSNDCCTLAKEAWIHSATACQRHIWHDRADVVDYRKEYLLNLANIESSGPVRRIRVYHDESLYYANSL